MTILENGVRFNNDHYRKVFNARSKANSRNDLYCFAVGMKMGENGRVDKHKLYEQKFIRKGKVYTVDSVNIHFWNGGYYWYVVFVDENGSSAPRHFENINSTCGTTLRCIEETQKEFHPISPY
jgi:hypothetical protein